MKDVCDYDLCTSTAPHSPAQEHVEGLGSERLTERVDAVDGLRELGFSAAQVKKLKAAA